MKKLNFFLGLGAVALALFFNSCSSDTTNPAPTISFDNDSITLSAGDSTATITGTIVADAGLKQVILYQETSSGETQLNSYTSFKSGAITTTDKKNYSFRFDITGITQNVSIKVATTDNDDQTANKSIKIIVPTTLTSQGSFDLGAAGNATLPSYYSVSQNKTFKSSDVTTSNANQIDIVFNSSSTAATLYSPDQSSNTTVSGAGNVTTFQKVSLNFDNITSTDIAGIDPSSKTITVSEGDVIVFKTNDGTKGALKISNLVVASNGSTTITVKVKK